MILVTGATGLTGGALVRRLSARGIPTRALVRNRERAVAIATLAHVEVVEGDMSRPDTLVPAFRGVSRAMLISGADPAMRDVQIRFIDAAAKAGVPYVVKLSGIMPGLDSPFRFARMHAEIEARLAASGMVFTNLRAGEFMQSYFRQVPSIAGKGILALAMADARIASIDIGDIAEVAAIVLTSEGHEGKSYPLTGPESLTMSEVAERLSRVLEKPIRYVNVAPEDARKARLAAGMPAFLADAMDELFAERRKGKEATVSPIVRDVFGLPGTPFEEFARRHAAVFRAEQPSPRE